VSETPPNVENPGYVMPGTGQTPPILRYFSFSHLPEGPLREASALCYDMAHAMSVVLPPGAELSAGLRKLLEAKDCFVRAALDTPSADT
jgi:hypothetical protein